VTPNEIQALIVGLTLGGTTVNVIHSGLAARDARRTAVETERSAKEAMGDLFLVSLDTYRTQQRITAMRGRA